MHIVTVGEVNNYIKRKLDMDDNLRTICVRGELSNFKHHYSGHMYMSLKDETGAIKAVMFRQSASGLKFVPKDGMSVLAIGRIGVYERDGAYQLYIDSMIPDGIGELYAAYERLKEELEEKGFFDESRKKPIPRYPGVIGVVTASTGAAVRDIINVISRRYPMCDIKIYPAQVQGVGAAETICRAIEFFNSSTDADVLIVGRGGGSIEDLWAFNERSVAEAVYASKIPVISAVGHETDYTIIDFVADLRAPTPSAAAEIATPDISEIRAFLTEGEARLAKALMTLVNSKKHELEMCMASPVMKNPVMITDSALNAASDAQRRLGDAYNLIIDSHIQKLKEFSYKLSALSPVNILSRGYAAVSKGDTLVTKKADVKTGDNIKVTVTDGDIECTVV